MKIREAAMTDMEQILAIYQYAREQMRLSGNPGQWGEDYPSIETVKKDIRMGSSFVAVEGEEIYGVFAFIIGEDPTYRRIENGNWLNDKTYGTIHRIASSGKKKGIFQSCLSFCEKRISNIRIDTHERNRIMQHLIEQNGFQKCGRIYVEDGSPRIAYQKERKSRMEKVIENFLKYVQIDTQSSEDSVTTPTTPKQHDLAKVLVEELQKMGAEEITYDKERCYVYAGIPASAGYEHAPVIGFIAHMDTSPAVTGTGVKPRIVEEYDGKDLVLNPEKQIVMKAKDFPELASYQGKRLIVTDGTTLLGADDKAGVAEIMAMAEYLLKHPEIPHGKVRIGFTPDEEVGAGADHFDLKVFGADYAYTVDGGRLGELEYENFNAAGAKVTIHGRSVHPGTAKDKMLNALLLAQEFQSMLPVAENPMYTCGYEGFYHLDRLNGTVEEAAVEYIIRDHDREKFEKKKETFLQVGEFLNKKYGANVFEIEMKDSYYNMKEIIEKHMHLIDNAREAMEELEIEPVVVPIRGGTDGARLSYMGLPCPNLCTGGANFHGRFEYACADEMEKITRLLVKLTEKYAKQTR